MATKQRVKDTATTWWRDHRRVRDTAEAVRRMRMAEALPYTRAWVVAEGLLLFVLGLTLDDVAVLRVPGFVVGSVLAVLAIAGDGVRRARLLSFDLEEVSDDERRAHLLRYRGRGRVVLTVTAVLVVFWLIVYTQGVPPWAVT